MKKLILILTLIMSSICIANDGYYSSLRLLSGNTYSQKEHPFVSIENEIIKIHPLILVGKYEQKLKYDIHYTFKNHSSQTQVVPSAFPVKAEFAVKILKGAGSKWGGFAISFALDESDTENASFFRKILSLKARDLKLMYSAKDNEEGRSPDFYSSSKFKSIRDLEFEKKLSYKAFKKHFFGKKGLSVFGGNKKANQKIDLIERNMLSDFKIFQDNKRIHIKDLYLTLKIVPNKDPKRRTRYKALFTIHFLHKLILKPNKKSKVKVSYKVKSTYASVAGSFFYISNRYILGSGRTWRGSIKRLLVKTPYYLTPKIPKAFRKIKRTAKYNYYLVNNYEPEKNDEIFVKYSITDGMFLTNDKNCPKPKKEHLLFKNELDSKESFYLKKTSANSISY